MAKSKNGPARTKGAKVSRVSTTTPSTKTTTEPPDPRTTAFAEKLGHMVGTMQVKAEDWMNREMLVAQLAAVRDGASHLLDQVTSLAVSAVAIKPRRKPVPPRAASKGRSGGLVDAPGKKHRKQGPKDPDATLARSQAAKQRAAMPMVKATTRRGRG